MKKQYLLLCLFFLSFCFRVKAQLDYAFVYFNGREYDSVAHGITPTLINRPMKLNQYLPAHDEGFANNIPIGFTFNYNGIDYTTININANGFATLGDPFITDSSFIENYSNNDLTHGNIFGEADSLNGYPFHKSKPIIAPLWDDLDLQKNSNLRYITKGAVGSRTFTIEWANVLWQRKDSKVGALSFELILNEGTNIVEFRYKDGNGAPGDSASASIGITDGYSNGRLFSITNDSSFPSVSRGEYRKFSITICHSSWFTIHSLYQQSGSI